MEHMASEEALFLPDCVCGSLRQASRAVTSRYEEQLAKAGLTATQYQLLLTIRTMRGARGVDLVKFLTMDQTTLTRTLGVMVRQNWLRRRPDKDLRSKTYVLTETGNRILDEAIPLWKAVQDEMLQGIHPEDWKAARRVMMSLIALAR
jgi:DNA-binding MarR family transcriptional regulator